MWFKKSALFLAILIITYLPITRAENSSTKILLSFIGDCTLGSTDNTRDNGSSFDSFIVQHGYDYPFLKTRDIFLHDDLTIANLEGCFYDFEKKQTKKTYEFRGPSDFVQILSSGGIDAVNLANNHVTDYGQDGVSHTIEALKKANIGYFGANDHTIMTYIYQKNGIKVGFLGSYISYWWQNPEKVRSCFTELKTQECDVIIASMHGGVEYDVLHDSLLEKMATAFIGMGADIVIGHHPHTIQGIDIFEGKTVIYSLGNFCFGGNNTVRTKDTFIAQITLTFADDRYLGHQLNIIPAFVSGTFPNNNYQPVVASGEDAERIIRAIQKDSNFTLNPQIINQGAVQEFIQADQR